MRIKYNDSYQQEEWDKLFEEIMREDWEKTFDKMFEVYSERVSKGTHLHE